jgi:hypothetical protein
LSGNLNQYRINLEKKIGKDRLQALDDLASQSKRNRGFKFDRFALIEIILSINKPQIDESDFSDVAN